MIHLRYRPLLPVFVSLLLSAAVFSGLCYGKEGKIRIVATVLPLAEFARAIAGDIGEVDLLLPPGADVHTWQPRISDIRRLEKADLVISVGNGLEPWLESLLTGIAPGRAKRFEASAGLDLLPAKEEEDHPSHSHGEMDPHVWLDFGQDPLIVDALADALSGLVPDRADAFRRNAASLKERLRALDERYRTGLAGCAGRTFLVAGHSAFAYLARRYNLHQTAVYGLSPDAAPTTRETAAVISRAKAEKTATVFYEPSAGDKMARVIAAEIGADVRVLYPGHNLTPEQAARGTDFFRLMEENLENLIHGFAGRR